MKYVVSGSVQGRSLVKGMKIQAGIANRPRQSYRYEILGFTGDEENYGDGGIKFDSAKEMLNHYGVKSLEALEDLQRDKNTYGYASYLVVRDMDSGEEGAWMYLYEGRWAIGSGAEKVTFFRLYDEEEWEAKKVQDQEEYARQRDKQRKKAQKVLENWYVGNPLPGTTWNDFVQYVKANLNKIQEVNRLTVN